MQRLDSTTVLEINLSALTRNYKFLKRRIASSTLFMGVVKANAYGSLAPTVALHLQDIGANYLAVAYANEGIAIRAAGVTLPVLLLHPQLPTLHQIIEAQLEPALYSFKTLDSFAKLVAQKNITSYPVHLTFNTGLNRLGFAEKDIPLLLSRLQELPQIKVVSIFSHLAASEDMTQMPFTKLQVIRYNRIAEKMSSGLPYRFLKHLVNTSGILQFPEAHFNMVRSGIGLYGFGNTKKLQKNFTPVATLKSRISQIHHIQSGETVGYNRAFKAVAPSKIATIALGHADGITRIYGNKKGFVFINNQKAFIVGNVCMDMMMIDITDIECEEGDEVIVFDNRHTAEAIAENAGTISYELITAISERVKRVIKE